MGRSKSRSRSKEKHKHKSDRRQYSREYERSHKHKHKRSRSKQRFVEKERQRQRRGDRQRYRQRSHEKRKQIKRQHQAYVKQEPRYAQRYYNQQPKIQQSAPLPPKQQPCWQPSGILLQYYNARQGVSLKFHQPPEAKPPIDKWRIYPFKGQNPLNPILLKGQSSYLIGKDERVCDILLEHPTVSRQHAVIQFREIKKLTIDGYTEEILPYIIDLDSSNGTFLNAEKIEGSRYVQILPNDKITFGSGKEEFLMIKQQ